MEAVSDSHGPAVAPAAAAGLAAVAPAAFAAFYPFIIKGFRSVATGEAGSDLRLAMLAVLLTTAFAVPAAGFLFSLRAAKLTAFGIRTRRIAFFTLTAPPLFVFSGILFGVLGIAPWRDWVWFGAWTLLWVWAGTRSALGPLESLAPLPRWTAKLRVAHGVAATLILVFVAFHLTNHLFALGGAETHTALMRAGRRVYQSPFIEPVLVALLLFQAASGLRLFWIWSARPADRFRVFQMASGFYMAAFVLVHMNTVLIYARSRGLETGWNFMTGQPAGLIRGSVHLVPHYTLGVFFVLAHLASGARQVALTHGASRVLADRLWGVGLLAAGGVAAAIMIGITR